MLDRARFICQTQSFNVFIKEPTYAKMTSLLFYQWRNGAKTGMYYLRSKAKKEAINFTSVKNIQKKEVIKKYICNDDVCVSCQ